MSGQARLVLIAGVILTTIMALLATGSAGSAATFEGHWSMYDRQEATSFTAGTTPFTNPTALPGYEIVGMDAKGVTESMETYQYWGASHVPPVSEIVSCTAAITQPVMSLSIRGAYPFGGCVFFLGVTNAGETDLEVTLGPAPGDALPVVCGGGPCQSSDVDVLAGGHTQADIAERCTITGAGPGGVLPVGDSLTYRIAPEYTFVCPLFVVVMQPACENCDYSFVITPEPTATPTVPGSLTPPISQTEVTIIEPPTATPTPPTPSDTPETPETPTATPETETPTPTPTEEAASPTATLTPVDEVAGARTPGAATATVSPTRTSTRTPVSSAATIVPTPRPPSSGSGVLVRRGSDEPHSSVPIALVAVATVLCIAIAWPSGRPAGQASYPMDEAAGGSNPPETTGTPSRARQLLDRVMRVRR